MLIRRFAVTLQLQVKRAVWRTNNYQTGGGEGVVVRVLQRICWKACNFDILNTQVVGVAQIINKMPGPVPFTEEDEEVISA